MKRTLKKLTFLCMLMVVWSTASHLYAANEEEARGQAIRQLESKNPPKDRAGDFATLKYQNSQLLSQLNAKNTEYAAITKVRKVELDNDINFLKAKIESLTQMRKELLQGLSSTQQAVMNFNVTLNDFFSNQLNDKSQMPLAVPVFRRGMVLLPDTKGVPSDEFLVIDLSHPVDKDIWVLGGEILTIGVGQARFVVLHHQEKSTYTLEQIGDPISITEKDVCNDNNGKIYLKSVLFSGNFGRMKPGDYYGVIISATAGLTYDELGTGSAVVMPLKNKSYPKSIAVTAPSDIFTPKSESPTDKWKRFSNPRNVGRAYSMNLYYGYSQEVAE